MVQQTLRSTKPTLPTKSKLLSIAASVQATSILCLKCSNHLVISLPLSSVHTVLQSPSLLLSSICRPVNPGSNQVRLTAWSHQVTHSRKVNSSARCSSSKPPTISLPSSAFYIHSPFLVFQRTMYLPHHGSGHSCNAILFFFLILQGALEIWPLLWIFLKFGSQSSADDWIPSGPFSST